MTQVGPVDSFLGDGSTTTFTLVNKTASQLGSTIQANNIQYAQFLGGFSKNTITNTFTLSTAPPLNASIVAPAAAALLAGAFDNNNVTGNGDNITQVPFWLGDPYNISQYAYYGFPQDPGILISINNLASSYGAQTSWCQLACSDSSGNALTFQATATPLYTAPIYAFGTLAASSAGGASSIMSGQASGGFIPGDYIALNPGASNFEICHVSNVLASTYTVVLDSGGPNFQHAAGEYFFTCARKFWLQVTIPIGQTNNTAANYYNLSPRRRALINARA
jgi:hypothetical protein